jgi:hypothetical protein
VIAPYLQMKQKATYNKSVALDLLDGMWPSILYRELKAGTFGAVATTVTMLIASLLTIVSGSLFLAVQITHSK